MSTDCKIKSVKSKSSYNKINIDDLEKKYEDAFNKWWEEDEAGLKDTILRGKYLSIEIDKARKEKYQYLVFKSFRINISKNPRLISQEDLTKTRFYTLLHRFIHKKYQQETDEDKKKTYQVSALVMKVNFTPDCCLTPFRFLLGTGFQHQYDIVIKDGSSYEDRISFVLGCMVLDWLSGTGEKSPRRTVTSQYESFKDYAMSKDALSGEVLSSGARHMKDKELSFLRDEASLKIFQDALDHITFDMKMNVFSRKVREIMLKIREVCLENKEKELNTREEGI